MYVYVCGTWAYIYECLHVGVHPYVGNGAIQCVSIYTKMIVFIDCFLLCLLSH